MIPFLLSSCLLVAYDDPPQSTAAPGALSPAEIVRAIESALSDAIAKAEPAVVAISREKAESGQETLAVRGKRPRPVSRELHRSLVFGRHNPPVLDETDAISLDFGSGVVIGNKGQILTAFHVVKGARRIIVRAWDRQQFDAEIIAADPRIDLAVIVPVTGEGAEPPRLTPIRIGDASRLRKGSFLVGLGNGFNSARDGKPSASWGILSNVARRVTTDNGEDANSQGAALPRGLFNYPTLLQLDSKLNLGMSGGAVINLNGELVGLTTIAASPAGFDAQAGYAIPMDKVGRHAVETLKDGREIEYGFLGIVAEPQASNRVGKAFINSPAALGQVQAGDEIVAVDDTPVRDFDSLILAINAYSAGDTVRLKVRRNDEVFERSVTLAKYPNEGEVIATNRPKPWRGIRVEYTSTLRPRMFDRNYLDGPPPGITITEVEEGSRAAAAGLKRGQLIQKVGDKPVANPPAFYAAVESLDGPVTLETDLGPVTVK